MSSPENSEIPENDVYQFLERTPPDWIIAHWGELAQTPRCPLDLFHVNPRFFLSWVLLWEKTAKDLFLPWGVTQAWESLCLRAWPLAVKTWEPETITRWCRLSNLWDRVQEKLFDPPNPLKSEDLTEAKRINPSVPWDVLQREFEARQAAAEYEEDNGDLGNISWYPPAKVIPAEVWPRAFFCKLEFPEGLLNQIQKTTTDIDVRRARLTRLCKEINDEEEKENTPRDDNGNPIPRDARGEEENQNLNPPTPQKTIIFRIGGEWDEIEPAFVEHRRRRDLRSFKWMGRVIIRVPGQTTPSGTSWEQFITSLRKKTEFTIEKQERLQEAAQKLHRDWNSPFSEADQMVVNFLQFIARTHVEQRIRDDPIYYLKLMCIVLNVIGLLENIMPISIISDSWLQSTWEKVFGGKAPNDLDFSKLIKFILADGLNIPPLDVGATLQIRGIQPTPFTKEEFPQFCQSGSFEENESQRFLSPSREEEDAGDEEEDDGKDRWWHIFFPQYIDEKDAETYLEKGPEEAFPKGGIRPQNAVQLVKWARGKNLARRWESACHPSLPGDAQPELAAHWDFTTRLSLAANPGLSPQILEKLTRDVQPSVRAVVAARAQRGTNHITPLVGEILTPGEILWLLVAHPGPFFEFGCTSYGDGSEAYAQWDAWKGAEGAREAWAYFGGLLFESGERGAWASHIALWGLSPRGCGRYPCMYLGKTWLELTIQSKPSLSYKSGGSDSF